MPAKNQSIRRLFAQAEKKFGFRFACELHQTLMSGTPEQASSMLRKVWA